jgi:hypothetical protein
MARAEAPFAAARITLALAVAVGLAAFGSAGGLVAVRPARADTATTWPPPPELNTFEYPPIELAARPRLSVAVGMGSTFDAAGFSDGTHAVPAFFVTGGFGDALVGVDFEISASSAIGRYRSQDPIDRVAVLGFAVVRPCAPLAAADHRYRMRVLRTAALELGTGLERDGRTLVAGYRGIIHVGARVELPLTPLGGASELRVRLAAGRNLGLYTPGVSGANGVTEVGDTAGELWAALLTVF